MELVFFDYKKILNKITKINKQQKLNFKDIQFLNYKTIILSKIYFLNFILIDKKKISNLKKNLLNSLNSFPINFEFSKNKVTLKTSYFFNRLLKLNFKFIKTSILILVNIFYNNKSKYTLFFGNFFKNNNINKHDLNKFFLKNKKIFNLENEKIVFNSNSIKLFDKKYFFKENLFLFVVINELNKYEKIKLILKIIENLFIINIKVIFNRYHIILYEDYLDLLLFEKIKDKNFINKIFFLHASALNSLPLWTFYKGFDEKKIYVFDSLASTYPIKFKVDKYKKKRYLPQLFYLNFKNFYISDFRTKSILKKNSNIKMIEPITFNIKSKKLHISSKKNICIFDINEQRVPNFLLKEKINHKCFYSNQTSLKFLESILKTVKKLNDKNKLNVYCYLKRKPAFGRNNLHIKNILKLRKKYNFFKMLDPQIETENYYNNFKTVISYPNTSQSLYFSKVTKKKSIYYDVENLLDNSYGNNIELINNEKKLEKKIKDLIRLN